MRINPLNLPTLLLLKWFARTQKTLRQGYFKKENRHNECKKKPDKKKKKKQQNKKQTSIQRRANASFSQQILINSWHLITNQLLRKEIFIGSLW